MSVAPPPIQPPVPPAPPPAASTKRGDDSSIWRRIAIAILVIIGCLALVLGNFYAWVVKTTLTTDAWVAATAPLAADPAVQQAVGTLVTDKIHETVDIEAIVQQTLPPILAPVAPAISAAITRAVDDAVFNFIASDRFDEAWQTVMREGHAGILGFVEGTTVDPTIPLKIDAIVTQLDQRLSAFGIDIFPNGPPPSLGAIAIRIDDRLEQARTLIMWAERLVWIVPLVALGAFALALALGRRRGRLFVTIALSCSVALALSLVLFRVAASEIASLPVRQVYQDGVAAILAILLDGLFQQTTVLLGLAVVITFTAWLARSASRLAPVQAFVVARARILQVLAAGIALVYLVLGPDVTIARGLLVAALAVAAVIGIEAVRRDAEEVEASQAA